MILVDTHVVVWLTDDEDRISTAALRAIRWERQHGEGLAISAVTLYELAVMVSKRRIRIPVPLKTFLAKVELNFVVKPITGEIAVEAIELSPSYPGDPMDRIIGATALVEGLKLVTGDAMIQKSKAVPTIW